MTNFSNDDHEFMATAIRLAGHGRWTTMPNPKVGCIIVNNGNIVGKGWHEWAGEAHAEVHALHQAGKQAIGATVYVSLEPCSHHGRTPPCAEALIKAKVAKVICAMQDPNPTVAGKGITMLRNAGISVATGLLTSDAKLLNKGFIKRMETGKPLVRAKLAMSVDGRTAMASGESQWITGSDARSDGQRLRASSCAIISGVGTILQDNSSLTVREQELNLPNAELIAKRQPLRVIVDSQLLTPATAKILSGKGRCLIVTTSQANTSKQSALQAAGAEVLVQHTLSEQVDLHALLQELGRRECNEVLLESGATLAGAMLQQGLLDEFIIYMAPVFLGSNAKPLINLPLEAMADKKNIEITEIRAVGQAWRINAIPKGFQSATRRSVSEAP